MPNPRHTGAPVTAGALVYVLTHGPGSCTVRDMNTTCTHCQEPIESDGYCADGCALYIGSMVPVTADTLAHERSTSCLY